VIIVVSDAMKSATIDLQQLFDSLTKHVLSCKSAHFVLNRHASFESWFRVELVPVLQGLGYSEDQIQTDYTFPGSRNKADLYVRADGDLVFELKPFVKGQDSRKKERYPRQIKNLENIVESGQCQQVIALTTFVGYTKENMQEYMKHLFGNSRWRIIGPSKVSGEYALHLAVCTMIADETKL